MVRPIVVTVRDKVLGAHLGLYVMANAIAAVRSWGDTLVKDEVVLNHPEDFELVAIGYWNETDGAVEAYVGGPTVLVTAQDILRRRAEREQPSAEAGV